MKEIRNHNSKNKKKNKTITHEFIWKILNLKKIMSSNMKSFATLKINNSVAVYFAKLYYRHIILIICFYKGSK